MGDVKPTVNIPRCPDGPGSHHTPINVNDAEVMSKGLRSFGYELCYSATSRKNIEYGYFKSAPKATATTNSAVVPSLFQLAAMKKDEGGPWSTLIGIGAGVAVAAFSTVTFLRNIKYKRELAAVRNMLDARMPHAPGVAEPVAKPAKGTPPALPRESVSNLPKNKYMDVNGINYSQMESVTKLRSGDILPGSKFVLGDTATYNRELLTINFANTSKTYPILLEARGIGERYRASGGTYQHIVNSVLNLVEANFSPRKHDRRYKPEAKTIGSFMTSGGVCRHRSAFLQMALQEAGVPSRYMRGTMGVMNPGHNPHAWVEVDVKGDGSYSYVIDTMNEISDFKNEIKIVDGRAQYTVGEHRVFMYAHDPKMVNVVWRPKFSVVDGGKINAPAIVPKPAVIIDSKRTKLDFGAQTSIDMKVTSAWEKLRPFGESFTPRIAEALKTGRLRISRAIERAPGRRTK